MDDVLSQQEINTLLNAVKTGQFEDGSAPEDLIEEKPVSIKEYDLTRSHRIIRGRMPTYDVMNERLSRLLRSSFFTLLRKPVEVEHSQTQLIKFNDFVESLEEPACLNLFRMPPLRNVCLLSLEPELLLGFVDHLFGGGGTDFREDGREFSGIENHLIKRLSAMVLTDMKKVWEQVYAIEPEFIRTEMNPNLASITAPTDVVIKTTFTISLEASTRSSLSIVIPYSVIEPIKSLLSSTIQADQDGEENQWTQILQEVATDVAVEIRALLGFGALTVRELLALEIGSTIQLESDSDAPLPCHIQGVAKVWGEPVNVHGRVGIKLNNAVGSPPPENVRRPTQVSEFRFGGTNDE